MFPGYWALVIETGEEERSGTPRPSPHGREKALNTDQP